MPNEGDIEADVMRRNLTVIVALLAAFASPRLWANAEADVEAATQQWIAAMNHHNAAEIVGLYAPDAVFFGTASPVLRDKPELVWDYFKDTGAHRDSTMTLGDHRVQLFGAVAVNTGFYSFRRTGEDGKPIESAARFTFVYQRRKGKWMIVEHHSSRLPTPQP
jgi:uncharacterized protein (TIGR02246 family)